ncbi:M16 family metallopeptidase [Campylobacter sputorum]|uniref:M16 family metallopeptidase n=1 Tax=Campylobacter sputorum TaxID=206 RepID=UPI00053BDBB4|nr:pitrilysin family protein [Campylobacter sputorum]
MLNKFNKKILKNKMEIYHIPVNIGSNVISVDIFYKVGSRNEIMGKSGIAHMLEHLNFKSTKNLKAGEFDEIVKGFGGIDNASTGFDYTHYFIKCSKQNLEKSLYLFSEIMENLNLKDSEFQPERDVVLEERRWRTDNTPMGYLYFRLFNHAFLHHPYHWTPIGFYDDIQNWSIKDIKNFHSTFYQPQNAFLIVSGDIDKKSVFDLSKKYFEHIKNKSAIPNVICQEPLQDGAKKIYLTKQSDVEMIAIAYKIPPFNHEDSVCLEGLSEYLSNGKSSLLQRVLVDEKKLVNQIYAYNMDNIDESLFIIIAICNNEIKAEIVEKEINLLIEKTKNDTISKDDFTKIKNSIKAELIYSLQSASKVSSLYGSYIAKGDLEPLLNLESKIEALDSKMLQKCAQKYFVKHTSTTVILRKENK